MSLIDTLEYFIDDTRARLSDIEWEIREETNYDDEDHQERMDQFCEEYDEHKERLDDLLKIQSELERLQRYDNQLSSVMPEDYKDWWQNSKEEWPIVAKGSIESLREREEQAWQQVEFAYEEMERNK
jgi:G3E family GTPase